MKSLRKLHTGKPYVQFERRTEASVRATLRASSDPSITLLHVVLQTCTVAVRDLRDVEHSIEVTAETLYEAIATALAALQQDS